MIVLLQPRKSKRKSKQKNRTVYKWTLNNLTYGDCGLKTLQPLRMSSRQIYRFRNFIKRAARKSDTTNRFVWFNTFPHLPLTKKPRGQRMGKGAGKLNSWQIQMRGGVFIFEYKNVRPGRAIKFFKRAATKIPTPTKAHFSASRYMKLNGGNGTNPMIKAYW